MSWSVRCGFVGAMVGIALPACGGRYERNGVGASGAGAEQLDESGPGSGGSGTGGSTPTAVAGNTAASGAPSQGRCSVHPTTKNLPARFPAQNVSGDYEVVACGQEQTCTVAGQAPVTLPLPPMIGLTVQQAKTLELGTVTLHGTGEPLLDDRPFDALFDGRSFSVELHGPLSATCAQDYSLSFHYDFDAVGPRSLRLDFERLNSCSGNAGPSCKGRVESELGYAKFLGPSE